MAADALFDGHHQRRVCRRSRFIQRCVVGRFQIRSQAGVRRDSQCAQTADLIQAGFSDIHLHGRPRLMVPSEGEAYLLGRPLDTVQGLSRQAGSRGRHRRAADKRDGHKAGRQPRQPPPPRDSAGRPPVPGVQLSLQLSLQPGAKRRRRSGRQHLLRLGRQPCQLDELGLGALGQQLLGESAGRQPVHERL